MLVIEQLLILNSFNNMNYVFLLLGAPKVHKTLSVIDKFKFKWEIPLEKRLAIQLNDWELITVVWQ